MDSSVTGWNRGPQNTMRNFDFISMCSVYKGHKISFIIGCRYTFNAWIKLHNFHPRKPHHCIEYSIHVYEFYLHIVCIMKNKEKSAVISCIMVSLTGLHTKFWSVPYDYKWHSFPPPSNTRHAQESITNNLNFMDISFTCKIFGSQDTIKILLFWDSVPCNLLHTKLYDIKPKMTNFMVLIMCMFLQSV